MYLTRFRFNTARRGARGLLSGPNRLHAAVLHGFPEPERLQGDGGRILWRLDATARHDAVLYIASPEEPDLTHLVEQAGWPARGTGWDTRPYGKLLASLDTGQRWAFRLTANPVHFARTTPEGPKRWLPHVTPDQQLEWLLDRCAGRGFTIPAGADGGPNVAVHDRTWLRFTKSQDRREVTIRAVTYEGVLEIGDVEALRHSLVHGIGKAKAYGCGLLTLAPLGGR
ncbi:type I-E CRISPR-associated protein Cas6/Cse3/CasE [Glycomyces mayteni]|uniref:Type I-E CRISPR-associated protein Cas6/Cse3/CasE n=1 Tax=Glycomyces mayteni TaxID=543887 RepID=A0ABW2DCV9_9ACTN|nr:type I-E CRISPR-associated protein Cas6/Cse3/CasE [Glycomyces mayteni]